MPAEIQLIVGLGNPGAEYEHTRHNAGAWFVFEIAQTAKVTLRHETKYQGLHAVARLHGKEFHLLIPTTFMNLSGQSVKTVANYYKIPPESILVAHDEIDLPCGIVRLKYDGGHGGHNGLKDIINHLGTKQFYRLRIGVDHPGSSDDVSDYVLTTPNKSERQEIDSALACAYQALPLIVNGEFQKAMQELNT